MRTISIISLLSILLIDPAFGQDPYPGLTIISLRTTTDIYLLARDFNVVKIWHGADVLTELAYMLPDSSVLRPCRVPDVARMREIYLVR